MNRHVYYIDHAAATPVDERVLEAMQPYMGDIFYNPSAMYTGARMARDALEDARRSIAMTLGVKAYDIVCTAGASESISLALVGMLSQGGHAVIGATEHTAVRAAVQAYPHTIAEVDARGVVQPQAVRDALCDTTVVVSVALADSEFGTIQPIRDIAAVIDDERRRRRAIGNTTPLYLHSDGSQVAGMLDVKVSRLGVDMLTLSAAKCYGPKQVGLLWFKSSIRLASLVVGGGQERGLRGGTENVAGVVGFACALSLAQQERLRESARLRAMRDELAMHLRKQVQGVVIDGHPKHQLPNYLHIHVDGLDAERVVYCLDAQGVYVATGSACSANFLTRSPALLAIGLTPSEADGSLRITLGKLNQAEDILPISKAIANAIAAERGI